MRIIRALLAEHAAMHPVLNMIKGSAPSATLPELETQATCLQAVLISHADIEEALLGRCSFPIFPRRKYSTEESLPATMKSFDMVCHASLTLAMRAKARLCLLEIFAKTRHALPEGRAAYFYARGT